jgi:hypothetical protein
VNGALARTTTAAANNDDHNERIVLLPERDRLKAKLYNILSCRADGEDPARAAISQE